MSHSLHARLKAQFGDAIGDYVETVSPFTVVKAERIADVARFCRDAGFDSLMCLSGLDTQGMKAATTPPAPDAPKPAKPVPPPEEIAVLYHLGSTTTRETAALRISLDRAAPHAPSVADVWPVANWHEREVYDMFGILFDGHPDLTRILCPDDWAGWPLRKDYVFPEQVGSVPHRRAPSGGALADRNKK